MACRFGANPNFNLSSFDNLLHAVLWIFASITLEGWVDAMYAVNQANCSTGLGTFFVEGSISLFSFGLDVHAQPDPRSDLGRV